MIHYDVLSDQVLPEDIDKPQLKKALGTVMNFDKDEPYENHLKWLCIKVSTLYKRFEDGKNEGREER